MAAERTRTIVLALALCCAPWAAAAQVAQDPFAAMRMAPVDPAEQLSRHLRTLAAYPDDLEALTGAGRTALAVGDANAAIGFYARAERLAPRDGRVKAGLATALLGLGKPRDAIRLFDDAVERGVPEGEIASDRGLAWDLRGDPKRAQRDYQLALRHENVPETVRRLALSTAIAGDQAGALALLDPLLRQSDRAAFRARAFVLAMTGDLAGASRDVEASLPPLQAQAMQPFLARMATLKPAEKALAVHFGQMPGDAPVAAPLAVASRGGLKDRIAGLITGRSPRSAPAVAQEPLPSAPKAAEGPILMVDTASLAMLDRTIDQPAAAAATTAPAGTAPIVTPAAAQPPAREAKTAVQAEPKPKAEPKKAEPKRAKPKAEPKPVERHWVQLASGARKADLPRAWEAIKAKAPALLKGKSPSTVPVRATNRLLVGPFGSKAEAQALVNKLPGAGLSGFVVTTDAGEEVVKLAMR